MVFVPLSDDNPRLLIRYPYVSWTLIAINVIVYIVFQSGLVYDAYQASVFSYGVIPAVVFGTAALPPDLHGLPGPLTFVSSVFLHGDPIHLIGNCLFILVFADNIEDSMGHWRFALFYVLCGVAGAAAHAFAMPTSEAPLIGASGAISGVVAAYLLLHPRVKMWILLFGRLPLKVTASWIILAWLVVQVASGLIGTDEMVAWWAHAGGFAAGAALIPLFKRDAVPWFGRPPKTI
jgi:membrane associated rhomboid family serine protease